jgi:hypothetical protein
MVRLEKCFCLRRSRDKNRHARTVLVYKHQRFLFGSRRLSQRTCFAKELRSSLKGGSYETLWR